MGKRYRNRQGHPQPTARQEWVGTLRRVDAHAGFFVPDDSTLEDLFIRGPNLAGAQDRDKVIAVPLGKGKGWAERGRVRRAEGRVIEILERGVTRLVGEVRRHGAFHYLLPLLYRFYEPIPINADDLRGAKENDRVIAALVGYQPLRAAVTEVIGPSTSTDVEMKTLVAKYEVPGGFPPAVLEESDRLPDRVLPESLPGRQDLRHLPILTIDPIDARDLDDAISFERVGSTPGRFRLGVHIADVSAYVKPGTALDDEAVSRATSIYLVDGVVPMLPPKLSNGICSLNAGVDRLALSAFLTYTQDGRLEGATFSKSVIRVRRRFHYDEIDEMLNQNRYPDGFEFMGSLSDLAQQICRRRAERGSIDFDLPEVKLVLDESGKVKDVRVLTHTASHQLIEEFMIGANEAVADYLTAKTLPMIYRVHASPEPEKLIVLEHFLHNLGIKARIRSKGAGGKGSSPDSSAAKSIALRLQTLLGGVKGGPWERVVNYQLLRSMPKALYTIANIGHFGLGSPCYCHFTSPIRRYPDLTVHRMLSAFLERRVPSKSDLKKLAVTLKETAKQSTQQEIRAMEAERESVRVKLLEDMRGRVGEIYTGTVSGVVPFGLFVQLPNTVEGLLHVSSLQDDRYVFSEITAGLVGRRTGKRYGIGDPVRVRVDRVDLPLRQLDLSVVR